MSEKQHPGISMHNLPVGGGFVGLLFAIGSALIFLVGLPSLWYFVAFSAALGVGLALIFRLVSNNRAHRRKPLSILATREKIQTRTLPTTNRRRNLLQDLSKPALL